MNAMVFFFFVPSLGKGKNVNVDVEDNTRVGVEANVSADVNVIPTSGKQKGKRGRPRKTIVDDDIDQVIKNLLSDMKLFEFEDEDLFYDTDEVIKEKDGTVNWWDKVDYNIIDMGAEFWGTESDDSSDGLASLQGSDSNDVGKKKRYR